MAIRLSGGALTVVIRRIVWLPLILAPFAVLLFGFDVILGADMRPLPSNAYRAVWHFHDPDADGTRAELIVRSGAHDAVGPTGLAHYAEHLAVMNTVDRAVSILAPHANAWTTQFATGYFSRMQGRRLVHRIRAMADVLRPLAISDAVALRERDIVQREFNARVASRSEFEADQRQLEWLYAGGPLARPPIGQPADLEQLTRVMAEDHLARTHVPANSILLIRSPRPRFMFLGAGFLDLDAGIAPERAPFIHPGDERMTQLSLAETVAEDKILHRKLVVLDKPVEFSRLVVASWLLGDLLDTTLEGGFARPLRFDAFIASRFAFDIDVIDDRHMTLTFEASPDSGVSLDTLIDAYEATLSDIATNGMPAATFATVAKTFNDNAWPDWTDRSDTIAFLHTRAVTWLQNGRDPLTRTQWLKLAKPFARDEINDILSAFAKPGRVAILKRQSIKQETSHNE